MTESEQSHWDDVYERKAPAEVSWYQEVPDKSLALVKRSGVSRQDAIIDVGSGASTLVDHLLDAGYCDVTMLDLADRAFESSRERLGGRANIVNWVVADIRQFCPARRYRLWHDRAVLHFLTVPADRVRYVDVLKASLAPGGTAIIAVFGPDGPMKCSGLDIRRYNVTMLEELLGPEFQLQTHELENHETPTGAIQQFLYSCWTRRD